MALLATLLILESIRLLNSDNASRIKLENFVCESEWYHVYDFIEVVYRVLSKDLPSDFTLSINIILSSCLSRYRLIDGYVISVIDDNALAEISKALTWDGNISQHIKDALSLKT